MSSQEGTGLNGRVQPSSFCLCAKSRTSAGAKGQPHPPKAQEDKMDYTNIVIDDPLPSSYPGTEIVLG